MFVGVTDELQPVAPLADDLGGSTVSRGIATLPASERAHVIDDDERSDLSDVDACRARTGRRVITAHEFITRVLAYN